MALSHGLTAPSEGWAKGMQPILASRLGLLLSWWLSPLRREVSDSTGWHLLFGASVSFDHNYGIRLSWNLLAPWPKGLQPATRRSPVDQAQSHSQACQGHWECHCCVPRLRELLCSALLNKPVLLMSIWQFHQKRVTMRYQKVFKVVRICFLYVKI